jgi:hypothetical protein
MLRLAAVVLLAVLVAFPLAVLPAPPVAWLAAVAFALGTVGLLGRWMTVVTAAAALALIAAALALVIARPAPDPAAAIALGATLVLLLTLAHLAIRAHGAVLPPAVVAAQVGRWLGIVGLGVAVAGALTLGAAWLRPALAGATLPVVLVVAALGAALAMAGVIAGIRPGPGGQAPR